MPALTQRIPARRRCLCAGLLLTLAPLCRAQVPSDVQVPTLPTTWSSETKTVAAVNTITAAGPANGTLLINGAAQITFMAGAQISLEPGFHADATSGATFHAFLAPTFPVTFHSNPSGRSILVDTVAYTTPVTLPLFAGPHTVDASPTQSAPAGTRYTFQSWSDAGAAAHTIAVSAAADLTANFTTQYQLTTTASPTAGGSPVPPSGWYDSGAVVAVGVTVNNGYLFSGFSGALSGATTPQSLTMTGPASVTAAFFPDFTISTATGMATVAAGAAPIPITVNVIGPAGSTMTVTFDPSGLPAGLSARFDPASLTFTGSGSTTMFLTAPAGSGGYYVVNARGTSGSLTHSTGINLAVQDFTITPFPTIQSAGPNDTVNYAFKIAGLGGFNSVVTANLTSITRIQGGACALGSLGPSQQWDNGTLTLTLPLFNCTLSEGFNVTVSMGAGGIFHDTVVQLYIIQPGTFSLTATPATRSVPAGTSATYTVNVASANGFTGVVSLAQSNLPSCVAAAYPYGMITSPGSATLTLGTATCAPGTYGVLIVGTSGTTNQSVTLSLVVQGAPAPANIISPNATSTLSGDSATFTWDSGSQVTQYQLDLAASDDATVCSPRFTGGSGTSAVMSLSPCCRNRRRPLTATLTSTFAAGNSQARTYGYTCGPMPSSFTISGIVTLGGSGLQGVTVTLSGDESQTATTAADGSYTFTVASGGTYTVTPTLTGYGFNPPLSTYGAVTRAVQGDFAAYTPPTCSSGVTPGFLGHTTLGQTGQSTATYSPQVTASPNTTAVDFLVYHETQSIADASVIPGAVSPMSLGNSKIWEAAINTQNFSALGSYAVAARVRDASNHSTLCSLPAFFSISKASDANPQPTSCNSIAGTWMDSVVFSPGAVTKWELPQSLINGAFTGGHVVSTVPNCGTVTWDVKGTFSNGTFSLTADKPSSAILTCIDGSFVTPMAKVTVPSITISGTGCDHADSVVENHFDAAGNHKTPTGVWTSTASIPSSETSQFTRWDPFGYTASARFKGVLKTYGNNPGQFSGRAVAESGVSVTDNCNASADALLGSDNRLPPVGPSNLSGTWAIQGDSTYGEDLIGYGPAVARFYQTYVHSCTLNVKQSMGISTAKAYQAYATNEVVITLTPTQVTVQRADASACKLFPGGQACTGN